MKIYPYENLSGYAGSLVFSEGKEGSNRSVGESSYSKQNEATSGRIKVHKLNEKSCKPWGFALTLEKNPLGLMA